LSLWCPPRPVKGIDPWRRAGQDRDKLVPKPPSRVAELFPQPIDMPGDGHYTTKCCARRCLTGSLTVE